MGALVSDCSARRMMGQKRILLIDDEPTFTQTVKALLEAQGGYLVAEESDSRNAIDTARRFRPHLIFLDVMMPELDGGDIAQQIEADPALKGTPIIFFTGLVSAQEAASDRIGGYRFIAKPIRLDQLMACVREILHDDHAPDGSANPAPSSAARFIRRFKPV